MQYVYSFLLSLLNAFLCAHFAKKRGRNVRYWFIGGVLFGFLALAALFILPRKVLAISATASSNDPGLQAVIESQTSKLWYYLDKEGKQCGPLSFDGLTQAWKSGKVHIQSFVWNEELEDWKRLDEVARTS